jgi:surface-adhesin protein E
MPFTIRPNRRFSAQCSATYNVGPFFKLPLLYCSRLLSLVTVLLLRVGPAYAEWKPVYEISELATTVSVDPDTIHRKGDLVELWVLYDSKITQSGRRGPLRSTKTQIEFECEARRVRTLAATDFSGNMGSGKAVYSNSDKQKWEPVQPGSAGHTLWKVACGKQ